MIDFGVNLMLVSLIYAIIEKADLMMLFWRIPGPQVSEPALLRQLPALPRQKTPKTAPSQWAGAGTPASQRSRAGHSALAHVSYFGHNLSYKTPIETIFMSFWRELKDLQSLLEDKKPKSDRKMDKNAPEVDWRDR